MKWIFFGNNNSRREAPDNLIDKYSNTWTHVGYFCPVGQGMYRSAVKYAFVPLS